MMGSLFEFISSASLGISTDAAQLWDFAGTRRANQNKADMELTAIALLTSLAGGWAIFVRIDWCASLKCVNRVY